MEEITSGYCDNEWQFNNLRIANENSGPVDELDYEAVCESELPTTDHVESGTSMAIMIHETKSETLVKVTKIRVDFHA